MEALGKRSYMEKKARSKFIQAIYDAICQYTMSPTADQRRQVCRQIITDYPFQADVDGGCESWYRILTDKCKNECRGYVPDPMVMARKRKNPDGSIKQPNPAKGLRRGIVKWAPPHIEGEDEASHARHVTWMHSEWKKKEKRHSLVTRKMDLTYSFRREYLTKEMVPLLDIKEKYPFLFDEKEVRNEYCRLMADEDAATGIEEKFLKLGSKIIEYSKKKNLKGSEPLLDLLKCDSDDEEDTPPTSEDQALIALCLLPMILERAPKNGQSQCDFLYQNGDDAKQIAHNAKEGMTPFIIFEGQLQASDDIYLSGERNLLLKVNGGHTSALVTLLLIYFVCNIEYPKECRNTYLFLQREVLNVYDSVKLPTKVLQLMNELTQF
ncbi:uncharacterized protein [Porites lutea]|uniref:uncharacterized protein n=1 Tax=Porites lutea TaxID=51062 RepID=UPI003CC5F2C0